MSEFDLALESNSDSDVIEELCDLIRKGSTVEHAAYTAGLDLDRVYQVIEHDEYAVQVERANDIALGTVVAKVMAKAQNGEFNFAKYVLDSFYVSRGAKSSHMTYEESANEFDKMLKAIEERERDIASSDDTA